MCCVFCAVSVCVCKFKALRSSGPCGGEVHPLESRPRGLKFTGHGHNFNTKQEINKEPPSPTCLRKNLMLWNLESFQRTILTASTSIDTAVECGQWPWQEWAFFLHDGMADTFLFGCDVSLWKVVGSKTIWQSVTSAENEMALAGAWCSNCSVLCVTTPSFTCWSVFELNATNPIVG